MKNLKLEKTDLISLWTKFCANTKDTNLFLIQGSEESPYYLLDQNDNVSLYVSATKTNKGQDGYSYRLGVLFDKFVEYANYEIDKSEFESLINMFVKQKDLAMKEMLKEVFARGEEVLKKMIED
jgi:hypothetical protein